MSDLIDRQAAVDALGEEPPVWYDGEDEIAEQNQWKRDIEAIKQLPPIQPAEPKRGKWIDTGSNEEWYAREYRCSECGDTMLGETNFCPNCGAKMEVYHE